MIIINYPRVDSRVVSRVFIFPLHHLLQILRMRVLALLAGTRERSHENYVVPKENKRAKNQKESFPSKLDKANSTEVHEISEHFAR